MDFSAHRKDGAMKHALVWYLSPLPQSDSDGQLSVALGHPASTTRAEHRKLPKSMMIGKALLTGLWAHPPGCFTVRFTVAFLTLERVSLYVSPFFSPLSLRRGVVVVCFEVIKGESLCHSACAMWSRGSCWGDPCFRMVLCCFSHLCVWPCVCLFSLLLCLFSCFFGYTRIWWHNAAITCMNPPMNWVPVILVCPVLACSGFVVLFCVLVGFVLCVFAVCLVYVDDGPMDYVQVTPVLFCGPQQQMAWNTNLHYCLCNVIQRGKRPGESHEGVGREKSSSANQLA